MGKSGYGLEMLDCYRVMQSLQKQYGCSIVLLITDAASPYREEFQLDMCAERLHPTHLGVSLGAGASCGYPNPNQKSFEGCMLMLLYEMEKALAAQDRQLEMDL